MIENKIRVVYSKTGPVRFISHLDMMRTIFRGVIRADLPIALSKGFSPHQLIAFGPPLSVGMEGENEFFDISLGEFCDLKKIINDLQYALNDILAIKDVHHFSPAKDLTTKDIDLYRFEVYPGPRARVSEEDLNRFMEETEVFIERGAPDRVKRVDIRPLVRKIGLTGAGDGRAIALELSVVNGLYASPYDVIKALFRLDDSGARGIRVRRMEMCSTKKRY